MCKPKRGLGSLLLLVFFLHLGAGCPGEVDEPAQGDGGGGLDGPGGIQDGPPGKQDQQIKKDKPPVKLDKPPVKLDKPPVKLDKPPVKLDKPPVKQDHGSHDIGKACKGNGDCVHGLCAQNTHTGKWFCTKKCDPCQANPCPTGSGCQNAGPMYICAPNYPNAKCPKP